MKYGSNSDPYLDENGVLKNCLGAKSEAELDLAETIFVLRKLALLLETPIEGKFDLAHLKAIHRYLFEEIYPWAGQIRTVSIRKGNTMFALPLRIETEAKKLFSLLKQENYLNDLPFEQMVKRLAFYLGEINILHPFREGNGRTQRAFIMQLAEQAGYRLDFSHLTPDEMIEASIKANRCDYSGLEQIIYHRLVPL